MDNIALTISNIYFLNVLFVIFVFNILNRILVMRWLCLVIEKLWNLVLDLCCWPDAPPASV